MNLFCLDIIKQEGNFIKYQENEIDNDLSLIMNVKYVSILVRVVLH